MPQYSEGPQSPFAPIDESSSPSSSSTTFTVEQNTTQNLTERLPPTGSVISQTPKSSDVAVTMKQYAPSQFHDSQVPHQYDGQDTAYIDTIATESQNLLGTRRRIYARACRFWALNRSYLLVIISTFFGSLMTLLTKLLEDDGQGMHAFQILWCRMFVSWFICAGALYYAKPAEFPFGPRKVRWLLVTRGIFGFIGIGGIWTALSTLIRRPRTSRLL